MAQSKLFLDKSLSIYIMGYFFSSIVMVFFFASLRRTRSVSHAREPSYNNVPEWRNGSADANLAHSSDIFAIIKFPGGCFYYSFLSYLLNFSSEQGTFGRNKYLRKFTPVRSQSNPNETLGKLLGGALTTVFVSPFVKSCFRNFKVNCKRGIWNIWAKLLKKKNK